MQFSYSQDLELELFASNLERPVNIKHAGDDRLFVVEQQGFISIINSNGTVNTTPFLDIDTRVTNIGGIGDERGLLGLAFHPDYNTNGYFYVNYTDLSGNSVISRFTRNATNPSIADSTSELIILTYNQPFSNHNGGDLNFGADGYLYIASGDGGSGGDPQDNAQDTSNLLGNILRIDINTASAGQNYSIPTDNPFIGNSTVREEIWAYGLRNPWKFSFDRMNGDIWIGDVGQGDYEEINMASSIAGGLNYGWRCYEGSSTFNLLDCPYSNTLTFPVSEYGHFDGEFKCSITGGYRYRGSTYSDFEGLYFFADYCSGEIGYLEYNTTNSTWNTTLEDFSGNWSAFGEDIDGEIYISDLTSGNIYRLTDALLNTNDFDLSPISIYPNPAKNEININFSNDNSLIASKILIYSLQGKVAKIIDRNSELVQTINTSDLSSGLYILKIHTENGKQNIHKLVIN